MRKKLYDAGIISLTSRKFQYDVLNFIVEHAGNGDHVIEVGCYLGGLTGQIAYLTSTLGIKFSVIELNCRRTGSSPADSA